MFVGVCIELNAAVFLGSAEIPRLSLMCLRNVPWVVSQVTKSGKHFGKKCHDLNLVHQ